MTAVIITKGSMFPFLQEVRDARKIRNRILSNFELATEPGLSKAECRRLLHIVIVGGGPTGVEFGAEIYDFVEQVILMVFIPRHKVWRGIMLYPSVSVRPSVRPHHFRSIT